MIQEAKDARCSTASGAATSCSPITRACQPRCTRWKPMVRRQSIWRSALRATLLQRVWPDGVVAPAELGATEVVAAVVRSGASMRPPSPRCTGTGLRELLRFFHATGMTNRSLVERWRWRWQRTAPPGSWEL